MRTLQALIESIVDASEMEIILMEAAFKKLYHVSEQAGIQKFRGRWSPKIMMKGIFAAPEKNAIYRSWAGYVAGKKFPDEKPSGGKAWYDNLTLYTLAVPNDIYREIEKVIPKAMDIHQEMGTDLSPGAWSWDAEEFIPEEYLEQIKIIGRETLHRGEFIKRERAIRFKDPAKHQKGPARLAREELSDFLADALLKNPASPVFLKLIKTKVLKVFDARIWSSMGEYSAKYEWKEKLILSPSEKNDLKLALRKAKDLLVSMLMSPPTPEEISQSAKEEEEREYQAEMARFRAIPDPSKTDNWRGVSLNLNRPNRRTS